MPGTARPKKEESHSRKSEIARPKTQRHVQENLKLQQHICENLRFRRVQGVSKRGHNFPLCKRLEFLTI
jgi:hypothetical protein